jgi:hypothetical protein
VRSGDSQIILPFIQALGALLIFYAILYNRAKYLVNILKKETKQYSVYSIYIHIPKMKSLMKHNVDRNNGK